MIIIYVQWEWLILIHNHKHTLYFIFIFISEMVDYYFPNTYVHPTLLILPTYKWGVYFSVPLMWMLLWPALTSGMWKVQWKQTFGICLSF